MSTSSEGDEIFTLRELAAYLKVNPRTVYRLLSQGEITGFRVGHSWRFRKDHVDAWTRAGGSPAQPETANHG